MTLFPSRRPAPSFRPGEDLQAKIPAVRIDGVRSRALESGRTRLLFCGVVFFLGFGGIAARMIDVSVLEQSPPPKAAAAVAPEPDIERADIIDRNGVILATSLPTVSLFAKTSDLLDTEEVAERLASVLPGINIEETQHRLSSGKSFVYLARNLSPRQQYDVNALGIPGLQFEKGERRVYPLGPLAAHAIGMTDVDGNGVSGLELRYDERLRALKEPLRLSMDIRMQTIVRNELANIVQDFNATGGVGIVMDVRSAEVLAMVSLPDFDPNDPPAPKDPGMFNRVTKGVYEMGSTFKLFNTAAALDYGTSTLASRYDATQPLHMANAVIHDTHAENRWLDVAEILIHSSNIGAARMAFDLGTTNQRAFLTRVGMLAPMRFEVPELGTPQYPEVWREINTATIAFGHGLSVTPLHLITGVSALINGGIFHQPTLIDHDAATADAGQRIEKPRTSDQMRLLMRAVVESGTGKYADVPGYRVGGKTGTAEKAGAGGYRKKAVLSSFIAAFPIDDPRYAVLVMVDEPEANQDSHGQITGGWIAAPSVSRIIAAIAPMTGIEPRLDDAAALPTAKPPATPARSRNLAVAQ